MMINSLTYFVKYIKIQTKSSFRVIRALGYFPLHHLDNWYFIRCFCIENIYFSILKSFDLFETLIYIYTNKNRPFCTLFGLIVYKLAAKRPNIFLLTKKRQMKQIFKANKILINCTKSLIGLDTDQSGGWSNQLFSPDQDIKLNLFSHKIGLERAAVVD